MAHPEWLYYLFALAMLAVAAYSVGLLALSLQSDDPAGRDVDIAHLAMGVTMAGMFVPHWAFWPSWLWEAVFFVLGVWFVVRAARSLSRFGVHVPHEGIHATMSLAMLLMYLYPKGASSGGMSMSMAMSPGHGMLDPGVSFVLAMIFFTSAIFTLASPHAGASHHGTHRRHLPAYAAAGRAGGSTTDTAAPSVAEPSGPRFLTSPRAEDLSHVVMCVGMGFMLVLML